MGPRGEKGERGEAAPTIALWYIGRERYRAIPFMTDGSPGPELNLRELFEQFQLETSSRQIAAPVLVYCALDLRWTEKEHHTHRIFVDFC